MPEPLNYVVPFLFITILLLVTACGDALPTEPRLEDDGPSASAPELTHAETAKFDGTIRVGIAASVENGLIDTPEQFSVTPKNAEDPLFTSSGGTITVELDADGFTETRFRLQTYFTGSEDFKDNWLSQAADLGYETYVEDHPTLDGWRLLIGSFPEDAGWAEREEFRQEVISAGLAAGDSFWRTITHSEGDRSIVLHHKGEEYHSTDAVAIEAGDKVIIEGNPYRGKAEVVFTDAGLLSIVNVVPLDEYLYGVVPRELPPAVNNWGELEAQKAQAITARTFALTRIGARSSEGFDVLPTTADQVYGGLNDEHPQSTEAVNDTKGMVATHNGALITTVYHSTSGGFTANNEDVWNASAVEYLRGVPDAERGRALEKNPNLQAFQNASNARNLRGFKEGDYGADQSVYHRWYFEWSADEMSQAVSEFAGSNVGAVHEINVVERSESGRVSEIEFVTDQGSFTEQKDQIRWALQFFNEAGTMQPLLSTLFIIEPVLNGQGNDEERKVTGFEAHGGGWGHGIGMSQTGAAGMAARGRSVDEILSHYYRGVEITHRDY